MALQTAGLVRGCSSVTVPGLKRGAAGTGGVSALLWPCPGVGQSQPPPLGTHLALQLLDELLEPVDLSHPLAVVLDTNPCTAKGTGMSPKKSSALSLQKLAQHLTTTKSF